MDTVSESSGAVLATARPRAVWHRQKVFWFIVVVVLLLAAVNLALSLTLQGAERTVASPRPESSQGLTLAVPVAAGQYLAATLDNQVILLVDGEPHHRLPLATAVGGMAVSGDGQSYYVGATDGAILVLDPTLQPQRELRVSGRVVGLKTAPQGGFIVAHGIGAFSDRYFVSYFPPEAEEPAWVARVEFTINALNVTPEGMVVYATANSRVGALDAAGQELWKITLSQAPTVIEVLPQTNQIILGDAQGNLTLLHTDGTQIWSRRPAEYPVRAIATVEEAGLFISMDGRGNLFAVNERGELLFAQRVTEGDIGALIRVDEETLLAMPRSGNWLTIVPGAAGGAGIAVQVRAVWTGVNLALLAALLAGIILAVERWRVYLAQQARYAYKQRVAYVLIAPSLALILVFSYYPAAMAFYYSFTNFNARTVTEFIGLQNYIRIFTEDFYFRAGFANLVLIIITNILKTITVPLLVAELIFALRNEVHRYVFRTLFVLPAVVPGLISVYLWRMVYDPYSGLLNQLLTVLGMGHLQRAWLGNEQTALWAIIAAGFPYINAFPFLIFMGGLLNIQQELYDAAKIDGVSWWSRFWRIDVPLLTPQFRLLIFFAFSGAVQGFANIFIFTRGGPGYATYVPGLQMYFQIANGEFGYASAIGVVLFALVFMGTIFILRFRRQTLES